MKFEGIYFISLNDYPDLINPKVKIKDVKQKIKGVAGVGGKNQKIRLAYEFDSFSYDDSFFWAHA